ncbi:flagellar basal body-associated FliL family protein [Methylophaga sp. OBS3]|uniref:flagellar basal body-associated FliL family protein n=1 Tax=Methylophaga sp. OBS3 TaxID=2991934 RepID=UPI002250F705|nr:flagellar basal body-associated FliL family protein [Methylophaga sp. OBS3]MCX4188700.1 flagellar basal body-associated FliL family protein [Methylophaga sp. OBS3]
MKHPLIVLLMFCLFSLSIQAAEGDATSQYYRIQEPFNINFLRQSEQKARFLQIKVALKSSDPQIIQNAETNLPMIQDSLRILFADQSMETISSLEGRNALQLEAYSVINEIFVREINNSNLEAVYFTGFIWQ